MLDKFKITDRVAIITGGGQGIGKGIASIFAEAGAYVVISDMIAETIQTTAQELSEQGEMFWRRSPTSATRDRWPRW